jgi:hypothetical protein
VTIPTRHPDLKVKVTSNLEKCCAKALNKTAVEGYFDILEEVVHEYHIKPENEWNMDEKGVQLGIGAKVAAIIDRIKQWYILLKMGIVSL